MRTVGGSVASQRVAARLPGSAAEQQQACEARCRVILSQLPPRPAASGGLAGSHARAVPAFCVTSFHK